MNGREFKDAAFSQFARVAAAFGSPKRIELIDVLSQGERNVETLAAETGLSVANTSRHLQVMKGAGLVNSKKTGLQVVYRIAGPEVIEGYHTLRRIAEARIAELERVTNEFFGTLDGVEPIGREELLSRVRAGDVTVIDVRPIVEYQNGHIEGAISLPLEELARHLEEFSPDREIVAYCRGPYCVLALEAVRLLRHQGRKAVRLEDGFPEWLDAGLPVKSLV